MSDSKKYLEASQEGAKAVLDRMIKILGNPYGGSYSEVLDVNQNTIKTWIKRDKVPLEYIQGFALKYGESVDFITRGQVAAEQDRAGCGEHILRPHEQQLLNDFSACTDEGKAAILATAAALAKVGKTS